MYNIKIDYKQKIKKDAITRNAVTLSNAADTETCILLYSLLIEMTFFVSEILSEYISISKFCQSDYF